MTASYLCGHLWCLFLHHKLLQFWKSEKNETTGSLWATVGIIPITEIRIRQETWHVHKRLVIKKKNHHQDTKVHVNTLCDQAALCRSKKLQAEGDKCSLLISAQVCIKQNNLKKKKQDESWCIQHTEICAQGKRFRSAGLMLCLHIFRYISRRIPPPFILATQECLTKTSHLTCRNTSAQTSTRPDHSAAITHTQITAGCEDA